MPPLASLVFRLLRPSSAILADDIEATGTPHQPMDGG